MVTRKVHFPKQIVSTKIRVFSFRTQIVFASFSKNATLAKNNFRSQPPKTLFFSFLFEIVLSNFIFSLFSFSNIKRPKTKSALLFWKTLFLTPQQPAKKDFRTPTHYLWIENTPKHSRIGEKKQNKFWTNFWRALGPIVDSNKAKIGPNFDTSIQHVCIYI